MLTEPQKDQARELIAQLNQLINRLAAELPVGVPFSPPASYILEVRDGLMELLNNTQPALEPQFLDFDNPAAESLGLTVAERGLVTTANSAFRVLSQSIDAPSGLTLSSATTELTLALATLQNLDDVLWNESLSYEERVHSAQVVLAEAHLAARFELREEKILQIDLEGGVAFERD